MSGKFPPKEGGAKICVLDLPLLYEAKLDELCNTVWCASLPRETQLARLMARDGFTREEAENRLRSKWTRQKRRVGRTSSSRQTARLKKPPR